MLLTLVKIRVYSWPKVFMIGTEPRMSNNILYKELSYAIIGLAMEVHSKLGYGFLEKVYENSLMILFRKSGIKAQQ